VPVIPLSDGAGVVDAVGDGVSQFEEGDRVTNTFSQVPPAAHTGRGPAGPRVSARRHAGRVCSVLRKRPRVRP
jgi:NADPH:quinone reductase-like Zn-dependent oxidoreductase